MKPSKLWYPCCGNKDDEHYADTLKAMLELEVLLFHRHKIPDDNTPTAWALIVIGITMLVRVAAEEHRLSEAEVVLFRAALRRVMMVAVGGGRASQGATH